MDWNDDLAMKPELRLETEMVLETAEGRARLHGKRDMEGGGSSRPPSGDGGP